ncbi:hypothetical protein J2Y45_002066 [Dyadobacter sp. BE34]|uniref:DUF937 domain-containing protein n=1 Tax=Dyadobacter fermentans TaxID=94254 RepID=A0ABU1QY22_9BACT|nr:MULTISPECIES: hypothetical protein [Dyadobacter]MDR6805625.1 hypothetical protein [Dyadobacter fermentans]MDR7042615.1 hypothetical protein [Dyadobacter sp. BE242]MDR7196927.1 hypothetical protein [Dyadobacter sp. BE34]MDR7215638.1 hypothetical protein [Dyadobacter sp. BE31]MDR7263174.1 hypothetical protein [Dyadobacter sp. BE32]
MLEQLFDLVQQNSQQSVVDNPDVPNEHNQEVINTLTSSITGGLQEQVQSGNISGLLGLLGGESGTSGASLLNNPIVASIATNAIGAIVQKFGLNSQVAGNIVNSVLPGVLGAVIGQFNGGGAQGGGGVQGGGFDLGSLIQMGGSLFGGGNDQQQGKPASGGIDLGGMLGGLFGGK